MTEHRDAVDTEMTGDVELLIRFLNHQLDPERVALVRRRLEEDSAFLDFAAPLLLAWSVPEHWKRHPRPPGELEKHWDKFTKAAGFVHQRRKTRRRRLWMLAIVVAVVGLSGFFLRDRVRDAIADRRDYEQVSYDTGWIKLRDGSLVRLQPESRLRALKQPTKNGMRVKLVGSAQFRVEPPDTSDNDMPELQPLAVETPAFQVMTLRGEFTITTRATRPRSRSIGPRSVHSWASWLCRPKPCCSTTTASTQLRSTKRNVRARCAARGPSRSNP